MVHLEERLESKAYASPRLPFPTMPFMIFSVTYTICKEPNLDAQRFQNVTSANCQYEIIYVNASIFFQSEQIFTLWDLAQHIGILAPIIFCFQRVILYLIVTVGRELVVLLTKQLAPYQKSRWIQGWLWYARGNYYWAY